MEKFKDNLQLCLNAGLKPGDKHYEVLMKENLINMHSNLTSLIIGFNSFYVNNYAMQLSF